MKNVKLDRTDRIILQALQKNGRATNVELAKKAGISAPPCLRRIHSLEDQGIISGYHADVDHKKLGYEMMVFVHVSMETHAQAETSNFMNLVEGWPQVRACYMLSGESDYLLQVIEKDWGSLQQFMTNQLLKAPNVAKIKSYPTLSCAHYKAGVPIELD